MRKSTLWSVVSSLLVAGCAGSTPRLGTDGAGNLDAVAKHVSQEYQDKCYEPIARRNVPNDLCQFDLFDKAEREWGSGFGIAELKVSANKLMGREIETQLQKLLVYDQASQRYVASSTRTRYEIIAGLKDKYRIR